MLNNNSYKQSLCSDKEIDNLELQSDQQKIALEVGESLGYT